MLDRTQPRDWAAITDEARRRGIERHLKWIAECSMSGEFVLPRARVPDEQADHQADHATHIENGEVRIGRRR